MADDPQERTGREDRAATWPEADYREWVQSQVASRMFFRLGGITVATIIVVGGALGTFINSIREDIVGEAAETAAETLQTDVDAAVAISLLDQSGMIDLATEKAEEQLVEAIPSLIEREEFIAMATDAVLAQIQQTGGPQRLILEEARARMFDVEGDAATRALGLRVYALFHPGVRGQDNVGPLRETLVALTRTGAGDLPTELVEAMLEHYPVNAVAGGSAECRDAEEDCAAWDAQILEFLLDYMDETRLTQLSPAAVSGFFHTLSPRLATRALGWVRDNAERDLTPRILSALLTARDRVVLAETVDRLSRFAVSGQQPLERVSLSALGELNPDVRLPRAVRERALSRLWAAMQPGVAEALFAPAVLQAQIRNGPVLIDGALTPEPTEPSFSDLGFRQLLGFSEVDERNLRRPTVDGDVRNVSLEDSIRRRVVLSLLRPARRDGDEGGADEWNYTFVSSLGGEMTGPALMALSIRLSRDGAMGRDVAEVADAIMGANSTERPIADAVLAVALRHASAELFEATTDDYYDMWTQVSRSRTTAMSQAAFQRRLEEFAPGDDWLQRTFRAVRDPGDDFETHLLQTLMAALEMPVAESDVPLLEQALLAIGQERFATRPYQPEARELLIGRLLHHFREDHWAAAAIAENVALATSDAQGRHILSTTLDTGALPLGWIGQPLPLDVAAMEIVNDGASALELAETDPLEGDWVRLRVLEQAVLNVGGVDSGAVAVFDLERRQIRARAEMGQQLVIEPGEYAVHLRGMEGGPWTFVLDPRGGVVAPSTSDAPIEVEAGDYTFSPGDQGGELWLSVELAAGTEVILETMAATAERRSEDERPRVDTVMELYAPDGRQVERNDDSGAGFYSLIRHTADRSGPYLVRVMQYPNSGFDPDDFFTVRILINR